MTGYKLTYFDFSGSRGEECRLALHLAGVPFEDRRINQADWPALKASTPYGSMPVLEAPGLPPLAQSNAILNYIGHRYGMYPRDAWQAALQAAILESVEELRMALAPSGRISDAAEKKRAREEFAAGPLAAWAKNIERQIRGPFVAGDELFVADIKLYMISSAFKKGGLDHIPTDVLSPYPKLSALYQAVLEHPKVADWRARHP